MNSDNLCAGGGAGILARQLFPPPYTTPPGERGQGLLYFEQVRPQTQAS